MRPTSLLIDVGGILVQDQWRVAAAKLDPKRGPRRDKLLASLRRNAPRLDLGDILLTEYYDLVQRETGLDSNFLDFSRIALDDSLVPIAPNILAVDKLRHDTAARVIAASNVGPEVAAALDQKMGLYGHFDAVVRSYEVHARKPDPEFFRRALEISRAPIEQIIFLDDSEENVTAARRLGLVSVRIKHPSDLRPVLSASFGKRVKAEIPD